MTLREYYYAFLHWTGLDRYCHPPLKPLSETDRAILAKFLEDARKSMMLSKFGVEETLPRMEPGRFITWDTPDPWSDKAKEEREIEKIFHYRKRCNRGKT